MLVANKPIEHDVVARKSGLHLSAGEPIATNGVVMDDDTHEDSRQVSTWTRTLGPDGEVSCVSDERSLVVGSRSRDLDRLSTAWTNVCWNMRIIR